MTEQYENAKTLLKAHRTALDALTQRLLAQETVDGSAVKEALEKESA